MKYCKNCGMLLENSIERCIKCGADVSIAANVSKYPPEIEARMERERAAKKSKTTMAAALIGIFVVLSLLVGVIVWKISTGSIELRSAHEMPVKKVEQAEEPAKIVVSEDSQEPEEAPATSNREVKDEAGSYYVCVPQADVAGNHVFTAIYPEDINQITFTVDTEVYSTQFPEVIYEVVSNEDNSVRFTYMSSQQLWYQKSEKGNSKSDIIDIDHYMSFYKYEDAQTYIEALIKQGYPKAKKIELVGQSSPSEAVEQSIQALSQKRQDFFQNEKFGDYARMGEDAEYATMGSACSAQIFEYQITDNDKNVIFCKYYVPIVSSDLMYSTEIGGDMGTITEWYPLCVCGFEAGNDFDYEDYVPAFDLFCANAVPSRLFFYTNASYQEVIEKAIAVPADPEPLNETMLKAYGTAYKDDSSIGDVREEIYNFLCSYGSKTFSSADMTIRACDDIAVAFYDKENNKLFVSPDETEYPGDSYIELELK